MDEQQEMEQTLKIFREKNNDLNYQSILIATEYPDLPDRVKGLLTLYAIDHESSIAAAKALGTNILEKDKQISKLNEILEKQMEIIAKLGGSI